ncbi:MAG: allantoate amidohydrolase [Rhodocyclaceae bacterium]|nr:allantoate amidohydrolase [Rhodocyclaceae bacterium]
MNPAPAPHRQTSPSPGAARILERIEALARISEQADGLTRIYLSPQHAEANRLVGAWMHEAGLAVHVDAVGNLIGRREGDRSGLPCLMLGSHLDSVRNAGRYDGMLGVLTAIECVEALGSRPLPFAIEVVGFGDEEGVRFQATMLGSRAIAGTFDPTLLDLQDAAGVPLHAALSAFGLDPAAIGSAARRREDVLAYVEYHIEQGPVLEAEGLPVGVVTAINGQQRFRIQIDGMAGHSGTVPMRLRQDALAAAAECVLAAERIATGVPDAVATVGQLAPSPGATNVIAGRAVFSLDVRSPRDADRTAVAAAILAECRAIAARRRVTIDIVQTHELASCGCAGWLQAQLSAAIAADGHRVLALPSGAGHDAMAMVALTDVAMLFLRCRDGISHHPAESITAEDAATGARVLQTFIERFVPRR